jgi:hypothetical protein
MAEDDEVRLFAVTVQLFQDVNDGETFAVELSPEGSRLDSAL